MNQRYFSLRFPALQGAFTLVEMLVSLGVVILLAALLLPVAGSIRGRMDEATCLHNLRQLGSAFSLYAQDNDGTLPYARISESPTRYWRRGLLAYVDLNPDTDINKTPFFTCPAVRRIILKNGGNGGLNSFAMNKWLSTTRLFAIKKPAWTLLASEGRILLGSSIPTEILDEGFQSENYHRNGGGNNILYADFHAEFWPDITRLWNEPYKAGSSEDRWKP